MVGLRFYIHREKGFGEVRKAHAEEKGWFVKGGGGGSGGVDGGKKWRRRAKNRAFPNRAFLAEEEKGVVFERYYRPPEREKSGARPGRK